jgi:hypothetical protein
MVAPFELIQHPTVSGLVRAPAFWCTRGDFACDVRKASQLYATANFASSRGLNAECILMEEFANDGLSSVRFGPVSRRECLVTCCPEILTNRTRSLSSPELEFWARSPQGLPLWVPPCDGAALSQQPQMMVVKYV